MVDTTRREAEVFGGLTSGVKARPRAFTLIELLVVIAIIAILAAILLPVLNRAKQEGLKAQCISNFNQLQTSYRMYVDDNNDYLPQNFLSGGGTLSNAWCCGNAQTDYNSANIRNAAIFQYVQQVKIYLCPASTYTIKVSGLGVKSDSGQYLVPGQYVPQVRTCSIEYSMGGNSASGPQGPWTITEGSTWNSYQKLNQLQTTKVATKIVFVDEAPGSVDDCVFAMYPAGSANAADWWNIPTSHHLNGGIFGFADGHVEYWKWHGSVLITNQWETSGTGNGGAGIAYTTAGDSSDDLSRVQTGGPQYP